jgi:peroxiredoxin
MKTIILLLFLLCSLLVQAQSYKLEIKIANQPANPVVLGLVKGDRFTPTDSAVCDKTTQKVIFSWPYTTTPLTYRLVFGQTVMAKVMNEPPSQLDFIFNNENMVFETDFNDVEEKLTIFESAENKVWFSFRKELKMYGQWMVGLRPYLNSGVLAAAFEATDKRNEYNRATREREAFIEKSAGENKGKFVAKLIKMYREPQLDASLSEKDWVAMYRQEFFKVIDFSDPELVNSSAYTDKAIQYIQSYAKNGLTPEQQEDEFAKAAGIVLDHVKPFPQTFDLLLDYMMRGFEQLGAKRVLDFLARNYAPSACNPDEKTTLERRIGFQKIAVGNPMPDMTINNAKGNPVTLSFVLKEKNLLFFWASWCPHCEAAIMELKKNSFSGAVQIVAISIDTSKTEWLSKIKVDGIDSWINLAELKGWDGQAAKDYNVYATPTFFIIDKNLIILSKPASIEEAIQALKNQ